RLGEGPPTVYDAPRGVDEPAVGVFHDAFGLTEEECERAFALDEDGTARGQRLERARGHDAALPNEADACLGALEESPVAGRRGKAVEDERFEVAGLQQGV